MNRPGRTHLLMLMALAVLVAIMAALLAACGGDSKPLSLDEYLTRMDCETLEDTEEPETFGEFSESISSVIDRVSPLVPPAEIAEWHRTNLAVLEELKAGLGDFPKDDEIDLAALADVFDSLEEPDPSPDELLNRMPDDVRQRLDDAGCT